ncbi:NAPRTase-domain-containing protein [Martensiomyces pterosporus]|nr:NAPRTase-domain-containing protein [Martensiomyces pterosporus]
MSGPFGIPLPLLTDSYKASHFALYPEAQQATAYAEFRQGYDKDTEDERMVFYGIQYVIEEYVSRQWKKEDVDMAEAFFSTHNAGFTKYPFPKALFLKFIEENDGYFPVRIEALVEGSVVYPHTPIFQITAKEEYSSLVTYLETVLLMVWYPSTVATLSRRSRTAIEEHYKKSVDEESAWTLESRMHDFGFRGCTCVEQSMLGGAAHLLNFEGTDTLSAAFYVQYKLNNGVPVATSIPATEHSVMMSFASEKDALLSTIETYGEGVFACVMDSYDYGHALEDVLPVVAKRKLEKGGFMVIRPDSGDQVEAVLMGLRAADKVFGATINKKGFRVINGASVIQGDGVTPTTLRRILEAVHEAGYSAQCVGFGMGGGLLQKVNRDTMNLAVKLSSITYSDGSTRDIMKFPKEESGKTSLPGHFAVHPDPEQNGAPVAYRLADAPKDSENLLKVVYDCGPVRGHRWDDFATVRKRVGEQWKRLPPKASAVSSSLLAFQKAIHDQQEERVSQGTAFGV